MSPELIAQGITIGLGALLLWGIKAGITAMWNLGIKVELLTEKFDRFETFEGRINQNEKDINELHKKFRNLTPNGG